jgi:hypothetical protein
MSLVPLSRLILPARWVLLLALAATAVSLPAQQAAVMTAHAAKRGADVGPAEPPGSAAIRAL